MRIIVSFLLFILPTKLARLFLAFNKKVVISPNSHIGFSWISTTKSCSIENAQLGHFNYLKVNTLKMGGGKIGHLNYVCGNFDLIMFMSKIDNLNKFSSFGKSYHKVTFTMRNDSHITSRHLFDLSDSITIGKRTTIAGAQTQIWTHSFFRSKELNKNVRVDSPVSIGDWCYIGSRCNIMPGVNIGNEVTVGAQTVVANSLEKSGVYVGKGLRYIEVDFSDKIKQLGNCVAPNIYRK